MGTRFEVTLRVNSKEPLQAWPMQLRVDPNHFEVVMVRPGKLPGASDPNFTYRLNPDGNIFIGASNELGEFESGITASWWGIVPAVVVGGAATLAVAAAWTRVFPVLRRLDRFPDPRDMP